MLLDGLHIPLTTPFYPDGRLYLRKLEHNVDRYSRTPATGLALLTAIGERTLLSDDETRELLRVAVQATAPQKVLLANLSRDSVAGTLSLAETAAALRYDAILLHAPDVLQRQPQPKSLLTYFQAVADRSPLPILLEDLGEPLPVDLLAELSANPTFLGLVTHDGSRARLRNVASAAVQTPREVTVTTTFTAVTARMQTPPSEVSAGNYISADSLTTGGTPALATAPPKPALRTRTKGVGFQLLTGRTTSLLDAFENGAVGAMLPLAACAPQAVYEVVAAWKDGDPKLAAEKQQRLLAAAAGVEERLGVAAIKAACDLNGYYGGKPRLPLLPLTGTQRTEVEQLMSGTRN